MSDQVPDTEGDFEHRIHGTCVSFDNHGVLFMGASGAGKSATALAMIAQGAVLISDDQVQLELLGQSVVAKPIPGFEGMIEARGVGILQTPWAPQVTLEVVVDMDTTELQRLPPHRSVSLLGQEVPKIYGRENPFLVASLLTLLRGQRIK